MKNEPKRIYLQVGEDSPKDVDFNDLHEVTHSTEKIFNNDIEYYSKSEVIDFLEWIKSNYSIGKNLIGNKETIISIAETNRKLFERYLKELERCVIAQ